VKNFLLDAALRPVAPCDLGWIYPEGFVALPGIELEAPIRSPEAAAEIPSTVRDLRLHGLDWKMVALLGIEPGFED
jgi:hypothetical protein